MFVGLCGAICAGKQSVANFLIQKHDFKVVSITTPTGQTPPVVKHNQTSSSGGSYNDAIVSTTETTNIGPGDKNGILFNTVDKLLEYVTPRWREHFIISQIWNEDILEALLKRPFFLLVSVDAPIVVRWERYIERCKSLSLPTPTLTSFVEKSDQHMYSFPSHLVTLMSRASVRLLNPSSSLEILNKNLQALDLVDESRLRPTWDAYFMQLASLAAQRSNCMKRRVGCVVVREKRVVSTGYNGSSRGMTNCNEGGCQRCNSGTIGGAALSTCLCLHAEENALLEAGRDRIREGSILYCDTCPCLTCSIKIVQVGISEVVYSQGYSMDVETAAVLSEGGVKLRQFSPARVGVVYLNNEF